MASTPKAPDGASARAGGPQFDREAFRRFAADHVRAVVEEWLAPIRRSVPRTRHRPPFCAPSILRESVSLFSMSCALRGKRSGGILAWPATPIASIALSKALAAGCGSLQSGGWGVAAQL